MSDSIPTVLEYYARHGMLTAPHQYASLLDGLPADIALLCRIVQGIMLHIFWAERYGIKLSDERKQEVELRTIPRMLARLRELDDAPGLARPLTAPRSLERKLVGNCRDHTTALQFITGGRAWLMCRAGQANPDQ